MTLSERDWQRQVIDLARLCGWRVAHFRPARTASGWRTPVQADGAGFPDLVAVRGGELIFAELKSDKGKPTGEQQRWLSDLGHVAAVEAALWRPRDFELVAERLRGVRP